MHEPETTTAKTIDANATSRSRRFGVLATAMLAAIALGGVGCGKDEPIATKGTTTCSPAGGGRVPLADTGYTVNLPGSWCLYEWTKNDPVFQAYPYNGKPDPFLLGSTHGIKNREWAITYPKGNDIGIACTLYYFVAPVDRSYLEWKSKLPQVPGPEDMFGPPINAEYSIKYGIDATTSVERKQAYFENDVTKYYDLFAMTIAVQPQNCRDIQASLGRN